MANVEDRAAFLRYNADHLLLLFRQHGMSAEGAEAAVHALVDVSEILDEIYARLVPALLTQQSTAGDFGSTSKERVWDLREAFRHLDYHVHDSGLLDA